MSRKNVSAAEVRAWATENLSLIGEAGHLSVLGSNGNVRGRLHPEVVAAFRKANKSRDYATASDAERPTVTVSISVKNAKGANITKKVTLFTSEARTLLGQPTNTKGRFNMGTLTEAVQAAHEAGTLSQAA